MEAYFLIIWRLWVDEYRVGPSEDSWEGCLIASSSISGPQHPLTNGSVTPVFASVFCVAGSLGSLPFS